MKYAKNIGRIGALAVTLGVTAAVAGTPAIGYAQPSDSAVSDGDSPSPAGDPPPAGASPSPASADIGDPDGPGTADEKDTGLEVTAAGPADLDSRPTDDVALAKSAEIVSVDAPRSRSAALEGGASEDSLRGVAGTLADVDGELSAPATDVLAAANSGAPATVAPAAEGGFPELLGSDGTIFGKAAQLVRRIFFNQAPTVDPEQLSGQTGGLITGTVGAVDAEGDSIVYRLTEAPQNGSVTINPDGSYTYTPGPAFDGIDRFTVTATDGGVHINLLDLFRRKGTVASLEVTQSAAAPGLTFNFIYGTGTQYWSSEARSALQSAAMLLSPYFVVTSPVILTYDVSGENTSGLTLASADSDLASSAPGFSRTVVQEKILSGVDANGSAPDGEITVNFAHSWAMGNSVGSTKYDFQSVLMHELVHTFGFVSNVDSAGSNTDQNWTAFDDFVVSSAGAEVIRPDFSWDSAYNPNLTGGGDGLYFGGPNAVAAYGELVPLYTPSPWKSGSSMQHLGGSTFTGANTQLMNALIGRGPGVRTLSPIELGILEDLGYTVTSPPQTLALLFVVLPFIRRRRSDCGVG